VFWASQFEAVREGYFGNLSSGNTNTLTVAALYAHLLQISSLSCRGAEVVHQNIMNEFAYLQVNLRIIMLDLSGPCPCPPAGSYR
jgi:hypothetical protein